MVKKIIWTKEALDNKREIFTYWTSRNKSSVYSRKLNLLFRDTTTLIRKFPQLGRATKRIDVKSIHARDYVIFYRETIETIFILHIWDGRRDPAERKY